MISSIAYALSSPRVLKACFEPWFRLRGMRSPGGRSLGDARRIVLVKLDLIGDFVLSSPFIRELRQNCPSAKITLVVQPKVLNLAELCPHVNRVLVFDPYVAAGSWQRIRRHVRATRLCAREFWKEPPDLAIVPRWDFDTWHAVYVAYLSGARNVVGYTEQVSAIKRNCNRDTNRLLTLSADLPVSERHEVDRNLALIEAMGGKVCSRSLEVWSSQRDDAAASEFLAHCGVAAGDRVAAVAAGSWEPRKMWPVERYIELCRTVLASAFDKVMLVGGDGDRELTAGMARILGNMAIDAAGRLTLRQTACSLRRCQLYVGNDTGVKHIAAAVGVPVFEISCHPQDADPWNPLSPERFGAQGVPCAVIRPVAKDSRQAITRIDVPSCAKALERFIASVDINPKPKGASLVSEDV